MAEEANVFGDCFSAYGRGNLMGGLLAASGGRRRFVFHAGIAYREDSTAYNPNDTRCFDGQPHTMVPEARRKRVASSSFAGVALPRS